MSHEAKYEPHDVSATWRIMLSKKRWNQEKYERDWYLMPEVRCLPQSKGACNMVLCPKRGDSVTFVYDKQIVMKGIVESDGFEYNKDHQEHSSNIGENRPHAVLNLCAWVRVTEVGLSEYIRPTGQKTWIQMKDAYLRE